MGTGYCFRKDHGFIISVGGLIIIKIFVCYYQWIRFTRLTGFSSGINLLQKSPLLMRVIVSCRKKLLMENLILAKQTKFLASENHSFQFFQILLPPEVTFPSSENIFFKESFIPAGGELFSVQWKLDAFVRTFFAVGSHY